MDEETSEAALYYHRLGRKNLDWHVACAPPETKLNFISTEQPTAPMAAYPLFCLDLGSYQRSWCHSR
ncbi:hypothetical protein AFLA_008539 [Aspergillus flavus NRRL3357]|nr:hypothetical protein AFLA_008539 [Aspergillus flavus NRRL3357]